MSNEPAPPHVHLVLLAAIAAVSSSAVLVRAIDDVHPVALAAWRALGGGLILLPALRPVSRGDAVRILFSGACLAAHFAVWFASLDYTTVMHSTVLVCLSPAWVGMMEWALLGQRPSDRFWIGLALALPGIALMAGGDDGTASGQGDLLALVGGVLGAIYLVIGRDVRRRVGIGTYGSLVCLVAAALLFPTAVALDVPLAGYTGSDTLLVLACVLGPQLVGHNGYNYALAWFTAATVSSLLLLEPVGASVLAAAFLGEFPAPRGALGAALALVGVVVGTRPKSRGSPHQG